MTCENIFVVKIRVLAILTFSCDMLNGNTKTKANTQICEPTNLKICYKFLDIKFCVCFIVCPPRYKTRIEKDQNGDVDQF